MLKKVGVLTVIAVIAAASLVAYKIIDKPSSGNTISSFTDCGCGGCGGSTPKVESIKNTASGSKEFHRLKEASENPPSSATCATMGCSICTEYRLIEV